MKLIKQLKFRLLRTEKPGRLQIITWLCGIFAMLCLIAAVICYSVIEKDYTDTVKRDELIFPATDYVTILTENIPLYIYKSEDENIRVNYLSDSTISVYEEDGRLYVTQEGEFVITLFSQYQNDFRIEVYLPEKSFRNINITSTSASISCEAIEAHILSLNSRSGYVKADNISCSGTLTVKLSGADADINVSRFLKGDLFNEGGTVNLSFTGKTDISVLTGSRCYVNGIALSGDSTGDSKNRLKVSSPSGRVRITTG